MDYVYKLIFAVLFFFSGSVFADTYPATFYAWDSNHPISEKLIASDLCNYYTNAGVYTSTVTSGNRCAITRLSDGVVTGYRPYNYNATCPAGGSVSGANCINAAKCPEFHARDSFGRCQLASCPFGQILNPITHTCEEEADCTPPETDNGFGLCAVKECISGQVLNESTGQCQTPPTCGFAETYVNSSNLCELRPILCPLHSHANTANDRCLRDPPMGCPFGMHDDGTYTCVANDAARCRSDQTHGYINGIPQCINKANHDEAAAHAEEEKQKQAAADAQNDLAKTNAEAAAAAAAADPSNMTKQQASESAAAAAVAADSVAKKAKALADQAQSDGNSKILQSIAQSVKGLNDRDLEDRKNGFGTIPAPDVIANAEQSLTGIASGSSYGSCPAPYNIVTHHGTVTMSFQLQCDFAQKISPLVLVFSFLSAGLIVLGPIRDS